MYEFLRFFNLGKFVKIREFFCWGNEFSIYALKMYGIQIDPSELRYKITPRSDILAKVPRGGVLRPGRIEREKNSQE